LGPLSWLAFAQATDPARTPADTARAVETNDEDFNWGWLGLLGLFGLTGLMRREEPRIHREAHPSRESYPSQPRP
jgi:hypothetical protein